MGYGFAYVSYDIYIQFKGLLRVERIHNLNS